MKLCTITLLVVYPFLAYSQDYVGVEGSDLKDLKEMEYDRVRSRINSKNTQNKGAVPYIVEELKRTIHFSFEARIKDPASGVGAFAKWVADSSEAEIMSLGNKEIPNHEICECYFELARLQELVVKDRQKAKQLYLEGLKMSFPQISNESHSADVALLLKSETLKKSEQMALHRYSRLLENDEHQWRVFQGYEYQRQIREKNSTRTTNERNSK